MNLCPKCIAAIKKAFADGDGWADQWPDQFDGPVPESECEFWTHKKLNEVANDLAIEGMRFHDNERGIFISKVRLPHA